MGVRIGRYRDGSGFWFACFNGWYYLSGEGERWRRIRLQKEDQVPICLRPMSLIQIEMSSRPKEVQIWCLGEKKGLEIITGAMGVIGSPWGTLTLTGRLRSLSRGRKDSRRGLCSLVPSRTFWERGLRAGQAAICAVERKRKMRT